MSLMKDMSEICLSFVRDKCVILYWLCLSGRKLGAVSQMQARHAGTGAALQVRAIRKLGSDCRGDGSQHQLQSERLSSLSQHCSVIESLRYARSE